MKDLLRRFAWRGARLVIDSRSFSLVDLREMRPWLIKPNQGEISEYLGCEITDVEQVAAAAEQLWRAGIENVIVSMGEQGALLACDEGVFTAEAPTVEVCSTDCGRERIRTAVAYGSVACMTRGTRPPNPP